MSGRAKTFPASQFAAALLGCTILAGLPGAALAQDAPAAAPAPAPADDEVDFDQRANRQG